jgi:hypothetical protein
MSRLQKTKCRVKFANILSESFKVRAGLRQEDAFSPILFNLALEKVIRSLLIRQNMEISGTEHYFSIRR